MNRAEKTIQMQARHYQMVLDILMPYQWKFYAYGSRAKGTASKYSDLDICYQDDIPNKVISEIKEALEESNLPFTVDLTNWHRCDKRFQEIIANDLILITPTTPLSPRPKECL